MKVNINELIWYGRNLDNNGVRYFDYSSSGFAFVMTGKKAEAVFLSDPQNHEEKNKGVIGVYVTEGTDLSWKSFPAEPTVRISFAEKENKCVLYESAEEKTVTIRIVKLSEDAFGCAGLKDLQIDGKLLSAEKPVSSIKMEVIGDSITCGYGIDGVWEKDTFTTAQERADKSYAFLTAKQLNAELQCCSWSGIGITSNYVDPATVNLPDTKWLMPANWPYTDKSLSLRLKIEPEVWDGSKFVPDLVVIHLGTNDISWVRGIEERRLNFVAQYRQLIEAVHRRSPNAKILCMLGVMGQELCDSVFEAVDLFHKDFPVVAIKALKCPVQLESDGIAADWHPSAKTHEKLAAQLVDNIKNW